MTRAERAHEHLFVGGALDGQWVNLGERQPEEYEHRMVVQGVRFATERYRREALIVEGRIAAVVYREEGLRLPELVFRLVAAYGEKKGR